MAYVRYDGKSEWYIFWQASETTEKENELLAVWSTRNKDYPTISYSVAKQIIETNQYEIIPFYRASDKELFKEVLSEFIKDVDQEYSESNNH